MKTFQVYSEIGADGELHVSLGQQGAASRVLVTIQPAPLEPVITDRTEWHRFVQETYGSCAGLGLERPEQGEFEEREPIE